MEYRNSQMNSSIYQINKAINKSIEFKGLKAQYIWYLAGSLVALLIAFACMYIVGVNPYLCVVAILIAGTFLVLKIYSASNKYGEHGMMKKIAKRSIPGAIKMYSRTKFKTLCSGKMS